MNILANDAEETVDIPAMVYRYSCLPYVLTLPFCIILHMCVCVHLSILYNIALVYIFVCLSVLYNNCICVRVFLYCLILHLCVSFYTVQHFTHVYRCVCMFIYLHVSAHVCGGCLCEHTWMVVRGRYCVFLYHSPLYFWGDLLFR